MSVAKTSPRSVDQLIRPAVRKMHGYVPGEQPKIKGLVKLNTNENPYPPSPRVLAAVRAAVDGRLRLYPDPTARGLRVKLAELHGCAPENIVAGNGSDDLLNLAIRAFVEGAEGRRSRASTATVQYFWPSYSLYPTLAAIQGARTNVVALNPDFSLPSLAILAKSKAWDFRAALTFITTPNAPGGRGYSTAELAALCRRQRGVVVLDEAYVDFAGENAMELALKFPHVLVSRTFSKSYSLCFQRVGYFVGHPELISALDKVRDSYNVNGLGQVAAIATIDDIEYYRANLKKIIATRERLTGELTTLGFDVPPSEANFILARPPRFPAGEWLAQLRARKILVRWFKNSPVSDRLRITIGTDAEAAALVRAVRAILRSEPSGREN